MHAYGLKLIESERGVHVYFVDPQELKTVITGKRKVEIYRKGYLGAVSHEDFEKSYGFLNEFFEENGYLPPATMLGTVHILGDDTTPGIEIFANDLLFRGIGMPKEFADTKEMSYYDMVDSLGIDTKHGFAPLYSIINKNRRKLHEEIDDFLIEELYGEPEETRARSEKVLELVGKYVKFPEHVFQLHVLSEPEAKWVRFNRAYIERAIEEGVLVDIDWFLANKILAIHAVRKAG